MYKQYKLSFEKKYIKVYTTTGIKAIDRDRPSDLMEYNGGLWQVVKDTVWQPIDGWTQCVMVRLHDTPPTKTASFANTKGMTRTDNNFTGQLTASSTEAEPVTWFNDLRPQDGLIYGVYFSIDVDAFQDAKSYLAGFVDEIDFSEETSAALSDSLAAEITINNSITDDIDINLGNFVAAELIGPINISYVSQELCLATDGVTLQLYIDGTLELDYTPSTAIASVVDVFTYLIQSAGTITDRAATPSPLTIIDEPASIVAGVNQLKAVAA